MPEPGSHGYEIQRARLRDQLDAGEAPDRHATDRANEILQGGERAASPAMATGRAAGPAGERDAGSGDPGNVIDLRSAAFTDGAMIPERYTKQGDDAVVPLEWSPVPDGTREIAVLCLDPDAPGGTFLHWALTGLDPSATSVSDSTPPGATAWTNGFGEQGWGGPRPPVGDDPHRYVFRVHALGEPAEAGPGAPLEELEADLDAKTLAVGTLTGRFGR